MTMPENLHNSLKRVGGLLSQPMQPPGADWAMATRLVCLPCGVALDPDEIISERHHKHSPIISAVVFLWDQDPAAETVTP